jgi:transcriptional regulator with XRE-family HTH domain
MKKLIASALLSPEMHPDRVGQRITALRDSLLLSKAEFADNLELDRSTLTKVEAGKKGLDIAVGAKISDMYGVGLDFIYRGVISDLPIEMRPDVLTRLGSIRSAKAADDTSQP